MTTLAAPSSLIEQYLDDDVLNCGIVTNLPLASAVALSATSSSLRERTSAKIAEIRASLPPPYKPSELDAALAANDADAALPLLHEAMRRLKRNIEILSDRLLERGYPVSTHCAICGRRYLTAMEEDLDERLSGLRARGLECPLVLRELWRHIGGFALASPMDGAHVDWWAAIVPEVAEHFLPTAFGPVSPDPVWIDHGTAVLRAATEGDGGEYTLPVDFNDEEGFVFRTGHVLHLAPDALSKRGPNASATAAPGTYAVWLEAAPSLDPELLRFVPPTSDELGGAEPLWRPNCSLLRYLRLAVLEAGGFPGLVGLDAYEPLRQELTEGLQPF